jgi:hypothetical protein
MSDSGSSVSTATRGRIDASREKRLKAAVLKKVMKKQEMRAGGKKYITLEQQGVVPFPEEDEEIAEINSKRLSKMKQLGDMKDGDEHFNVGITSVGPVNDMYMMLKMLSTFGTINPLNELVSNTQINSGK